MKVSPGSLAFCTAASFTQVPRVDTEEEAGRGAETSFSPRGDSNRAKKNDTNERSRSEHGHEEEGLLRAEAPVADRGEL